MMPFFRSKSYSNYLTRHSIYKSKKFFAPLQVRTHKYVALLKQKKFSGKRALSWVSFGGRRNITKREKRGMSYIRSLPLFSAGGIFLRDPDHAYDPDGQAKADPGSSRSLWEKRSASMPMFLIFINPEREKH